MDIAIFESLKVRLEYDSKKIDLIRDALIKSLNKTDIIEEEVLYLVSIYRTAMIETIFGTLMPLRFFNDAIKTFNNISTENRVTELNGGQKGGMKGKQILKIIGFMVACLSMFNVYNYKNHEVYTLIKNPEKFTELQSIIDNITFKGELGKTIKDSIINNPPQIIHFKKKQYSEQFNLIQECLNHHNEKLAKIIPDKTLLPLFELKFTDNNDLHVTLPMSTIKDVIITIKEQHKKHTETLINWIPTLDTFGEIAFDTAAIFGTEKLIHSVRNIDTDLVKKTGISIAKSVIDNAPSLVKYSIQRPWEAMGATVSAGIITQRSLNILTDYGIKPLAKTAANIDKNYAHFLEIITGNPSEKSENINELFDNLKNLDTETNNLLNAIKNQAKETKGNTDLESIFSSKYINYLKNFKSDGIVINTVKDTAINSLLIGTNVFKEIGSITIDAYSKNINLLFSNLLDAIVHPVDSYHRITSFGTNLFLLISLGLFFIRFLTGTLRKPSQNKQSQIKPSQNKTTRKGGSNSKSSKKQKKSIINKTRKV